MTHFLGWIRASGVIVWMLTIMLPYWLLTNWQDFVRETEDRQTFIFQAAGTLFFLAAQLVAPTRLLSSYLPPREDFLKSLLVQLFFLIVAFLSVFSFVPSKSLAYAFLTWAVFVGAHGVWDGNMVVMRRMLTVLSISFFASLLGLLAYRGIDGRWVGGVQPNQFGQVAFVAMVAASFAGPKIRWASIPCAYAFALLVSSRSSLVAMTIFLAFMYLPSLLRNRHAIILSCFLGGALLAADTAFWLSDLPSVSGWLSEDVMLVNDVQRGMDSGATGRNEYWQEGWRLIQEQPLVGHGFRMAGSADADIWVHSGVLALFVDCGLAAGTLLLATILYDFIQRLTWLNRLQGPTAPRNVDLEASRLVNRCCAGYLTACVFLWAIEPAYVNLSNTVSVMFILLFMSPYVVRRPHPTRDDSRIRVWGASGRGGHGITS